MQSISGLVPGKYKLTAAAQNIQEDDATAVQSGAYIFAGDAKTTVTVRNTYSVEFTYVSGSVDIGFEAVNASGNWIAVDNFRLYFYGTPHDATGIDDINADANDGEGLFTDSVVYNLQGQKVGTSLEGLPAGIYIVN